DVSQTFNIASPPLTDLTASAKIPFSSAWATISLINDNDNPTIYLIGGLMRNPTSNEDIFISNVHTFNIKTLECKLPYINGKSPERRSNVRAVDDSGKIYIFGGIAFPSVGSTT